MKKWAPPKRKTNTTGKTSSIYYKPFPFLLRIALQVLLPSILLAACSASSAPTKVVLTLDSSFGSNGLAIATNSNTKEEYGLALAQNVDGGLLLGGIGCANRSDPSTECKQTDWAAVAWKFSPEGKIDPEFALNGSFYVNNESGGNVDAITEVIEIRDNYLLIGSTQTATNDLNGRIWALDPSGKKSSDLLSGRGTLEYDGTIQAHGHDLFMAAIYTGRKLWIAGGAAPDANNSHYRMAVWRFGLDGSEDSSFDVDGVWTSNSDTLHWGMSIAVDTEERPVIAGVVVGTQAQATVWRLRATGGLDASFQGGQVTLSVPGADVTYARAVMMDEDRIVIAGSAKTADGEHPVLWRLGADGALDADFGDGGILLLPERTDASGANFWQKGLALAKDEKGRYLLAGGAKSDDGDLDAAVWRILPSGNVDPDFCGGGPCTFDRAGEHDWASRLILDPEGVLYLGGWASGADGDPDAAIWKLRFTAAR